MEVMGAESAGRILADTPITRFRTTFVEPRTVADLTARPPVPFAETYGAGLLRSILELNRLEIQASTVQVETYPGEVTVSGEVGPLQPRPVVASPPAITEVIRIPKPAPAPLPTAPEPIAAPAPATPGGSASAKLGATLDAATPPIAKGLSVIGAVYALMDISTKTMDAIREKGALVGAAQFGKTSAKHASAAIWFAIGGLIAVSLASGGLAAPAAAAVIGALVTTIGVEETNSTIDFWTPGLQ